MPTVLVTGSSRGIGLEIVRDLLSKNNNVISISRTITDELKELESDKLLIVKGDLVDRNVSKVAVDEGIKKYGVLDSIILNHGVLNPIGKVSDINPEDVLNNININFISLYHTIQLALPHLRDSKGNILLVSSGAATAGYSAWTAYNASKAAMNSLARTLANEEKDITTIAIRPGVVDTSMQQFIRDNGNNAMLSEEYKKFISAFLSWDSNEFEEFRN
ncbi:NAD(P)-binding protein [Wallemia mellicola]|nr:NAD(P)-binding protein [Wallemia mellicola]